MSETPQSTPSAGREVPNSLPRYAYKISEVAVMLGVSQMSVRRMLGAGEIKAVRRFRSPLIPAAELVRFVGKAR